MLLLSVSGARADGWGSDASLWHIFRLLAINASSIIYLLLILAAGFRKTNFLRALSCIGIVLYGLAVIFEIQYHVRFPHDPERIVKEIYKADNIWIVYYSVFMAGLFAHIIFLFANTTKKQIRTPS